jgi:uncharacterized protein (TIGR03382 family)
VRRLGAFAIGLIVSYPAASFALTPPSHLDQHESVQVASGVRARVEPRIVWNAPKAAGAEWQKFLRTNGGSWRAEWDVDRKVPSRIFGSGIEAPGSTADAEIALSSARSILGRHIALLAPGASFDDFALASNHFDARSGIRSIGFVQHHAGLRVLGGQISVRIKNDRIFVIASEALPNVDARIVSGATDRSLREKAAQWIVRDFGSKVEARAAVEGPYILPIIRADGTITHRTVRQVTVDAQDPLGRWSVWLDARDATPVARKQTLMFASGTALMNAPERHPLGTRVDQPAKLVALTVNGTTLNADAAGVFTIPDGTAAVTIAARGLEVVVNNEAGANATLDFTIQDGQTFTWNAADDEYVDAQINTFVALNRVKDHLKIIAPDMGWLFNDAAEGYVNLADTCNAFSDGLTVNFFRASEQCENTARLADVVYHEFGHSFHAHAIIEGVGDFDSALSEGGADYTAASVTGDPGMGRGFFYSDRPLRHLDQEIGEATWPNDIGEPHQTGIIFGGAMWDLRKSLVATLGADAGASHTDQLFYAVFQRAADIPSSYVEVLAADDDDGDLSNGTPNMCAINDAFAAHGLADPETVGPPLGKPERTGFTVFLPLGTRSVECPGDTITDAVLEWRLENDPNTNGTLTLGAVSGGFEGDIPTQQPGQTIEYRVEVTTGNSTIQFPQNRAAPWYEMFVGDVIELYCNDFESDPAGEWSHELLAGEAREGADDWQWGVPTATPGSNDPGAASSGSRVFGNDLGGGNYNGLYQPNKQNVLHAPSVDAKGYTNVRLQYRRWLNVEDGNFDQAAVLANGAEVWSNLSTGDGGNTHHEDREWIFQDVDVSQNLVDGKVQIDFRITSDPGLEFGGWTIDDFCIVAFDSGAPRCGDGNVDPGEQCDDGNASASDGCELDCTITPKAPACGDGILDQGEACDDGNASDGDGCQANCTVTPGMMPDPNMMNPGETMNPGLEEDRGGCGCNSFEYSSGGGWLSLLLLAGLALLRRRR